MSLSYYQFIISLNGLYPERNLEKNESNKFTDSKYKLHRIDKILSL